MKDSRMFNSIGVFNAWEKSKADPEMHNFVKYLTNWVAGTKLIFIALLLVGFVYGAEKIDLFDDDEEIEIFESVEDEYGKPCSGCIVNLTLYNPDGTENKTCKPMTELSTGTYNCSLGNLSQGIYPLLIVATKGENNSGVSDRTQITVINRLDEGHDIMTALAFVLALVGGAFLVIYVANSIKEDKYYNQVFKLILYVFAMGFILLAFSSQKYFLLEASITNTNLNTIAQNAVIWGTRLFFMVIFVFFIIGFIRMIEGILLKRKKKNEYDSY